MILQQQARPRTLGLLGTDLVTLVQNQIWQGAMKAAQVHEARLVYYPAISLSSSPPFDPHTNVLFDFVDAMYMDGLLVWYAGVAEGVGLDRGKTFFDRYQGLPLVTIGGRLKNHPDLSIDNYQGVRSAVEHLIKVHNRRHIAMIRGPKGHPDADERYRSYVEALQAHDLPVNPDCVAETLFELKTAAEIAEAAISRWLRELYHGEIDAIVTGSDYMALAAVRAIEAHGLRVPEDIAVAGFDDVDHSQANIPSITTVRQPFYELGYQATEMLLALIGGQTLPAESTMPAQLIVRESCGCAKSSSLVNDVKEGISEPGQGAVNSTDELIAIAQDLHIPLGYMEDLATLLQSDLRSGTSQQFLLALKRHLIEAMKSHFNAIAWQNAISMFRKHALSKWTDSLGSWGEALFSEAHVLVTEVDQRASIRQRLMTEQHIENLRRAAEALITSFGEHILLDTLSEQLPQLGFPSFYLSLYENPAQPATWSRLILAHENGQRLELPADGLRFPTGRLVSDVVLPSPPAAPVVVEPLYFGDEQLGFLVLEAGPMEGAIYENLRAQISSALQGSHLLQQVQQYTARLEQRVAERTAELTQTVHLLEMEISQRRRAEEAIHQLNEELERRVVERTQQLEVANRELEAFSYSVSHDLRAPLRAINGFSNMLLENHAAQLDEQGRSLLEKVQAASQRMGHLIDDLLKLSRLMRGEMHRQEINLTILVHEVAASLQQSQPERQVEWVIQEGMTAHADAGLLRVVLENLLHNAWKFTGYQESPRIEVGGQPQADGRTAYFVRDNGAGFNMTYAGKLFGAFQRLHTETEFPGTGIGLATVQRIIHRHGGRVWAEAAVGQSATFFFTLG